MKTFKELLAETTTEYTIVQGWGTTFNINRGKGRNEETIQAGLGYEEALKTIKLLGGVVSKKSVEPPKKPKSSKTGYAAGGDIRIEVDPKDPSQWIVTTDKGSERVKYGRDWYGDYRGAKTAAMTLMTIIKSKNPTNQTAAKVTRVKNGKLVDI